MEEIMTNNEVTDVTETTTNEITEKNSGGDLVMAAVGGAAVLAGGLAVQYVIVPVVSKVKSKVKAWRAKRKKSEVVDAEFTEVTEESEDTESDDNAK